MSGNGGVAFCAGVQVGDDETDFPMSWIDGTVIANTMVLGGAWSGMSGWQPTTAEAGASGVKRESAMSPSSRRDERLEMISGGEDSFLPEHSRKGHGRNGSLAALVLLAV
jgi:hypothetical protein